MHFKLRNLTTELTLDLKQKIMKKLANMKI